jgi:hypothetical protein
MTGSPIDIRAAASDRHDVWRGELASAGGGVAEQLADDLMDRYLLDQERVCRPRHCFIDVKPEGELSHV